MEAEFRFTERALDSLPIPAAGRRMYYRDAGARGLRLEVSYTGRQRFIARMRVKGRQQTFSPGCRPEVTVQAARQWLTNLRADLNRNVAVIGGPGGQTTLERFFYDEYLERHLKVYAKRSWRSEESLFRLHFGLISQAKLADIERSDIRDLHSAVLDSVSPRTANRAKTLAHRIFSYALDEGFVTHGNPAARIQNFDEGDRDRFLMRHEMRAFFDALHADATQPPFRDFVLLALFTGGRRANVMAMRTGQVIPGLPTWRIPADEFKGKRVHFVPLVTQAAAIVRARASVAADGWLFPSHSDTGHMVNPSKRWADLCRRAGLRNLRIHDLRATLSTWMEEHGVPDSIRGKMLGHKDGGVIGRYSRSQIETVLKHVQPVVDDMVSAGSAETISNVLHLGRRA